MKAATSAPGDTGTTSVLSADEEARWASLIDEGPPPSEDTGEDEKGVQTVDPRELEIRHELRQLEVRDEARRRHRAGHTASRPPAVLLDDFLAVEDEPQRYRIDGLMPVGARVMLAAQFKAGKTHLATNAIRALVDGDDFLGRTVTPPPAARRPDNELDDGCSRRRPRDQGIRERNRVAIFSPRGRTSSFDLLDDTVRAEWAADLRALDASLVVLDCLRPILDALGLSEDKDAGRFLVAFDELLTTGGAEEAVVVDHMGHNGERNRGDSRKLDWPDVTWRLVREDENPSSARYFSAYGRDVDQAESALAYDQASRRYSLLGGTRKDAKGRSVVPAVLELLGTEPGLSGRQISERLAKPDPVTTSAEPSP